MEYVPCVSIEQIYYNVTTFLVFHIQRKRHEGQKDQTKTSEGLAFIASNPTVGHPTSGAPPREGGSPRPC
jgi:hypothetical protein